MLHSQQIPMNLKLVNPLHSTAIPTMETALNGILATDIFSNDSNPVHTFTATGIFEVTLTVTSKGGHTDTSSKIITVVIPTLLEIEVREYL